MVKSVEMPEDSQEIRGYDFEKGRDLDGLMESMLQTGFQATNLGLAVKEVNRMVRFMALLCDCLEGSG